MPETNEYSIWERIVATYRARLTLSEEIRRMEMHFPQFLSHTLNGNEFRIGVAEELQKEWFTQLYAKPLEEAIHAVGLGEEVKVVFVLEQPNAAHAKIIKPPPPPSAVRRMRALPSTLPLHENYTFKNFVRGPSNSFAYAAATAVAKGLGRTMYNPLFIWGGTGLGKTHLMEAIGHYVLENNPEISVCYITSESFLNEYVNALALGGLPNFRARYRKYDLLLLDDVQFIGGKKQFQEEFFNTIFQLLIYNKQVVMTSDVAPKELQGFEERLISRFQQGMVVEIELPSFETRLAILKFKMQARHRVIPDDILNFIAENIRSHVRAIEGASSRIITFMDVNPDTPPTLEIAKHLLRDMIEDEVTIKNITADAIIKTVAEHYGVTTRDIVASGRTQTLVTPRQVAMFLAIKLVTGSQSNIAKSFDRKHSTVYYGSQQIQKRVTVEPELKQEIQQICIKLGRNISDVLE